MFRPQVTGEAGFDNDGNMTKAPAWGGILNYEQAIRARAAPLMNEGRPGNDHQPMAMEQALKMARECQALRTESSWNAFTCSKSSEEADAKEAGMEVQAQVITLMTKKRERTVEEIKEVEA